MDEVDELIAISREIQPNPAHWKRYDTLYQEYRALYELLVPVHRRLYQIQ
jgi:sugar (pentulose or hexulose) kinase